MRAGRIARRGNAVSAQATTARTGKSLKPRARDQPAGQNQTKVEEKLKADKANADRSCAMLGEPPNTEEKQDAEQWLITMQDRQGGTAIDGKNQQSGTEEAVPQSRTWFRKFRAPRQSRVDHHKANNAGQTKRPIINNGPEIKRVDRKHHWGCQAKQVVEPNPAKVDWAAHLAPGSRQRPTELPEQGRSRSQGCRARERPPRPHNRRARARRSFVKECRRAMPFARIDTTTQIKSKNPAANVIEIDFQ
jgi:hypothetical protein